MKCRSCGKEWENMTSAFYAIIDGEMVRCPNCIQKELDALGDKGGIIKF
jgi:DNA-directed RNA polymerase subunit RPC12/RpoP